MTTGGSRAGETSSTTHHGGQSLAGRVAETVQGAAGQVADRVQAGADKLGVTGSQRDTVVGQATEQVSEQVSSRMDLGKSIAAESMSSVARALRQTGQHLRQDEDQGMLADYVDRGAEQIERFTGHLRQRSADQLLDEVEMFARRQPLLFAGGAFALGLLAARFFRSQPPQPSGYGSMSAYRSPGAYDGAGRSTTPSAYGSGQPTGGRTTTQSTSATQRAATPSATPPNYSSTPGAGRAAPGSAGASAPGSSDSAPRATTPSAAPGAGSGVGQRPTPQAQPQQRPMPQSQQRSGGPSATPGRSGAQPSSAQPTPAPGFPSTGSTTPARPGTTPASSAPSDRTPPPDRSGSGTQRNV